MLSCCCCNGGGCCSRLAQRLPFTKSKHFLATVLAISPTEPECARFVPIPNTPKDVSDRACPEPKQQREEQKQQVKGRGAGAAEEGEHVRRLHVTEGLLFAVLRGGREGAERRRRGRRRGSRPAQSACRLTNGLPDNRTNAAQETAALGIERLLRRPLHSLTETG